MTGVGQLPYTDTPSPIPRLRSPDAHMSHSLSLSLWEKQHGCLDSEVLIQSTLGEKRHAHPANRRTFAKKNKVHLRVPGHPWYRTLSQNPHHPALHTQLPQGDCLLSGSRTGKPSLALRRKRVWPTFHQHRTPLPNSLLLPWALL